MKKKTKRFLPKGRAFQVEDRWRECSSKFEEKWSMRLETWPKKRIGILRILQDY
jgi:hypothetical protein